MICLTVEAWSHESAEEVEEWLPVYGYTGVYEVSDLGRVRNVRTGKILKPRSQKPQDKFCSLNDYYTVCLYSCSVRARKPKRNHYIHRLVMRAFEGPSHGREVDHLDMDTGNNHRTNLEYVTRTENINRRYVDAPVEEEIPF